MDQKIINLYITFGTLPALFAQMNVYMDNTESYIWTRSGGTFVEEQYYPNNLRYYNKFDGFNDLKFFEEQYKDILTKIQDIKEKQKNVRFNVFCDDSRIQFILKIFIQNRLEEYINKIIMISEGSITEQMAQDVSEKYFDNAKNKWEELIKLLKNNEISENKKNEELAKIGNYAFYVSTLENAEYLIPNLDILIKNVLIDKTNKKMNLKDINFCNIFKTLTLEIREKFIKNALKDEKIEYLFNNCKALIITGTYNFVNNEITAFIYSNLINKVNDDYKKDYKIFYKAHPLFPVKENPDLEDFLNKHDIRILNERFPLELVLWNYENVKIGGFCSSIYALIPNEKVEFFFGDLNGFSKYIFKDDIRKNYGISLSQEVAAKSLKIYYSTISNLNSKEEMLNARINNILEEKENLNNRLNAIETDKEKLCNQINDMTEEKEKINLKIIKFEQEKIDLAKKISTIENQLADTNSNVLALKEENDYLKKHVKILEIPLYPFIWIKRKIKKRSK